MSLLSDFMCLIRDLSVSKNRVVIAAKALIDSKKYTYGQSRAPGYLKDDKMDCSEFVYRSYVDAGYTQFPVLNSHGYAKNLEKVTEPNPGDIVYWSIGHVGIVEDPKQKTFLGAQSTKTGLGRAQYKSGYFATRGTMSFHRYNGK